MTNEQFKEITGIDPYLWVCIERRKDYANGQSGTFDGKRILLESFVKRSTLIGDDDFSDDKLECERIFRGRRSFYTYYMKDGGLFADMMSESAYLKYLETYPEEDARRFASSTYVFEEKDVEEDVLPEEGIMPSWEFTSIDEHRFSFKNTSKINGDDYYKIINHKYLIQCMSEDVPMDNGLLVLSNGKTAIPEFNDQRSLVFATRYDVEADAYICEIDDMDLIATMTVGSNLEKEQLSMKVTKVDGGWAAEPVSTPSHHKVNKRRFVRIKDFRDAGLI